jgi:hypothetical protein
LALPTEDVYHMDKDQEAFIRKPNIILTDPKSVQARINATLEDRRSDHGSVLLPTGATLAQIGQETTASGIDQSAWISAVLSPSKDALGEGEAGSEMHTSIDPSNVRDDIRGEAFNGQGRGISVLFRRTLAPSQIFMGSVVPRSEQPRVCASISGAAPVPSPPRRSSATPPSRVSSSASTEESFKDVVGYPTRLSMMVLASSDLPEPQPSVLIDSLALALKLWEPRQSSDSKDLDRSSNLPDPSLQARTNSEAKQNADFQASSYFASNASAPLTKEKDTLTKLFESYRG